MITLFDCPHCQTTQHLKVDHIPGDMASPPLAYTHCNKCGLTSEYCCNTDAAIMAWNTLSCALSNYLRATNLQFTPGSGYVGIGTHTVRCDKCGSMNSKTDVTILGQEPTTETMLGVAPDPTR